MKKNKYISKLVWQSRINGVRSKYFSRSSQNTFKNYTNQNVLVVAINQEKHIRNDILKLLNAALKNDLYIVLINHDKIDDPSEAKNFCDVYIERFKYGRDFGMYKESIIYLLEKGILNKSPRLILMNDSVFYVERHLENFLRELSSLDFPCVGATENKAVSPHLGSFCLSFGPAVLTDPRFRKFWVEYVPTDIRPSVISKGELALSREVRRILGRQSDIHVLYDHKKFLNFLGSGEDNLLFSLKNFRDSAHIDYKTFNLTQTFDKFSNEFGKPILHSFYSPENLKPIDDSSPNERRNSLNEYISLFLSSQSSPSNRLLEYIKAELLSAFMTGSQIHQNQLILLEMGLPMVKLDGVYRGFFSIDYAMRIAEHIGGDQGHELLNLLLSRPYGGESFVGKRRDAFLRGYI